MSVKPTPEPRSILLIRLSSMGDVLLLSPFIRQIRRRFPTACIDVVTGQPYAEILSNNPAVDTVFPYDKHASRAAQRALGEAIRSANGGKGYDIILDVQHNARSMRLRKTLGTRVYTLDKQRLAKLRLVYFGRAGLQTLPPVAERYRLSAAALNIEDDGAGLELWLPEESGSALYPPDTIKRVHKKTPGIAIAPGAFHATKRWPAERFARAAVLLARRFSASLCLLGGEADKELCGEVAALIPGDIPLENASGADSVYATARRLDACAMLLCNDTGVAHIAAARRIPVSVLFGSTVPELGFAPYRTEHTIIQTSLPCRPCTHIGRKACPRKHFRCMLDISAEDAARQAGDFLAGILARRSAGSNRS